MKKPWEMFVYEYIETGWFSHDDRPKTVEAMRVFHERVPAQVLDGLPVGLMIFAPSPVILGEVFSWTASKPETTPIVYLSPQLEAMLQEEVNITVAHEMAHVVQGHQEMLHEDFVSQAGGAIKQQADVPGEIKADALIAEWGYPPAYEREEGGVGF